MSQYYTQPIQGNGTIDEAVEKANRMIRYATPKQLKSDLWWKGVRAVTGLTPKTITGMRNRVPR